MSLKTSAIACAVLLADSASAWSFAGHMIIARIAEKTLESEDPATLSKAKAILSVLNKSSFASTLTDKEGSHPFVECAPLADSVKFSGGGFQADWHFNDQPYLKDGGKPSDFNIDKHSEDVTHAINAIVAWFNKQSGYQNTSYYQKFHGSWPTGASEAERLSIALRFLIHYVGDSHQPLHSESMYNKAFPSGDRGGNSWSLPSRSGLNELHGVWDRVVYAWSKNPAIPFTSSTWSDFDSKVSQLMGKYSKSSLGNVSDLNSQHWQDESFDIASHFAYLGLQQGQALPDYYVSQGQAYAEKQLLKAGYRLANLLKSMNLSTYSLQNLSSIES